MTGRVVRLFSLPLQRLAFSSVFAAFGRSIEHLTMVYFLYQQTNRLTSPALVGVAYSVGYLATAIPLNATGVLDTIRPKTVLVAAALAHALVLGGLVVASAFGALTTATFVFAYLIHGVSGAAGGPASVLLRRALTETDHLIRTQAWFGSLVRGGKVLGTVLAGALIDANSQTIALLLALLTIMPTLGLLLFLPSPPAQAEVANHRVLFAGLRQISQFPLARNLLVFSVPTGVLTVGVIRLFPEIAAGINDQAITLSLLSAGLGVGWILLIPVGDRFQRRYSVRRLLYGGLFAKGIAVILLAIATAESVGFATTLGIVAFLGVAMAVTGSTVSSAYQYRRESMTREILSGASSISLIFGPAVGLVVASIADQVGAAPVLMGLGAIMLAIVIVLSVRRSLPLLSFTMTDQAV